MDVKTHGQTIFDMARTLGRGGDVSQVVEVGEDRSVRIPMYVKTADMTGDAGT